MGSANSLGKVLRCARIANDYTTKEAAELSAVTPAFISAVEAGTRKLSSKTLERISEIYKLTPAQLMKLVEYYDGLDTDKLRKYQLTVLKALEIILDKPALAIKKQPKSIYIVLKIARHANYMTLQTASAISGVSSVYISQLELDKRCNISTEYLNKLANAYNLTAAQIEELADYYENVDGEEERKFRLTLMKTLELIESNHKENP